MLSEERIHLLVKYYKWRQKQQSGKLKYIYNFMSLIIKNLLKFNFIYSEPKIKKCDILVLHPAAINKTIKKTASFVKKLQKKGFTIKQETISSPFKSFFKKKLCLPDQNIPILFKYFASYSNYIIKKYRPHILITFMDSSLLSPFLRNEMQQFGKVINIAHSFTAKTWYHSMTDFDYYFIFGQKSFDALLGNDVRVGNTNIILGGSVFIDSNFSLPPISPNKNILFFAQWTENDFKDTLLRSYDIFVNWARQHPEFSAFIKLHPRKSTTYWENATKNINNIKILDGNISILDALKSISLSVTVFSTASIESALLNRPVVIVNDSNMPDYYINAEDFFLPRAKTVDELNIRINETLNNYDKYLKKCDEFSSYHLAKKQGSMEFIADTVEKIFNDETVPSISLPENTKEL